jgi:plastocyanin
VSLSVFAVALLAPASLLAADQQAARLDHTWRSPQEQAAPTSADAVTPPPSAAASAPAGRAAAHAPDYEGRVVGRSAASETIADFSFSPRTITIEPGETITWRNDGPSPHSATADDGSFDTGVLARGSKSAHTFKRPGTYTYHCTPHPFMRGTVRVLAASAGSKRVHQSATGGSSKSSRNIDSGGSGSSAASSRSFAAGRASTRAPSSSLASTGLDVGLLTMFGVALLCCGAGIRLCLRGHDNRGT